MENNLSSLLRDFAQGASNSAATNVAIPVDAIAWLLRKSGVNVPPNPVMGSDWMAEKGLTREPKNKLAGLVGDMAGMVAPFAAAAKAPQIAKGLLAAGEAMPMGSKAAPSSSNQLGAVNLGKILERNGESATPSFAYPQSEAIKLAQQRAALPKSEGGLGLRADNTAMERADVMGFDTPAYHGTKVNDFEKFQGNQDKNGQTFVSFAPNEANIFARTVYEKPARVMPLLVDKGKIAPGVSYASKEDAYADLANKYKRDSFYVRDHDQAPINLSILNQDNIRSRFAAFDPWRRNAAIAASMGVAAPDLLAKDNNELASILKSRK